MNRILISIFFVCLGLVGNCQLSEKIYLSGTGSDKTIDWDFFCSDGRNSGSWTTIGVPSCWELQGFGAYNYGHVPFNERLNEYGIYKHQFDVSETWKEKSVDIVFEGVMTDAEVKINGQLAGEIHQGAFYEFKYSISNLLRYGEINTLEVKVQKHSSNESVNLAERKADYWIFGGIYRPVYLEIKPKDHIERMAIDANSNGQLGAELIIKSKKQVGIRIRLLNSEGHEIYNEIDNQIVKSGDKLLISKQVDNVNPWSPEFPHLYTLEVTLLDSKNKELHQVEKRIGFRSVKILEGDGMYVNNQKIKFKGVCRHTFHPLSGRTTNKTISIEHVNLMKEMNMNAVRMSHYPPDNHFLDACDSLGLFVIDEVAGWQKPAYDTEIGKKLVKETIIRDVNHPSIILWANGNEGGFNRELDRDYNMWDIQKREVIHPWEIFGKTNTLHYIGYNFLAYDNYQSDKIFFPTEMLHGLYDGGHGAGLEDYWKLMWSNPMCAGGFLWDFADESVVRVDQDSILDSDGNHAPDGILGPFLEKEGSFFTIKEIWSPIYIEDRYIRQDFNGVFRVENRFHYTNLEQCSMEAKWVKFETPSEALFKRKSRSGTVIMPSLKPGEKGLLKIDLIDGWQDYDALYLIGKDAHGQEAFTWSFPVKKPSQLNSYVGQVATKKEIGITEDDQKLSVNINDLTLVFSKENARLTNIKKGNKNIPLANGPIILESKDELTKFEHRSENEGYTITGTFGSHHNKIQWIIRRSGVVDLKVEMRSKMNLNGIEGISFSFPEDQVQSMKWLGDGPYRVWRNRMKGTQFGLWENDYNNTVTGELEFIYPEFKGYYSNLYWVKINGQNHNGFTVYCHTPKVFLRMLTPDQPSAPNQGATVKAFPVGDISFVKNIPAIGTKFKKANLLGPQSQASSPVGRDPNPMKIHLSFKF